MFNSSVCTFAYECSLLCAQEQSWRQRRKLKANARGEPYAVIKEVVRLIAAEPSAPRVADVLSRAEAALALDRQALSEFVAIGLFEGLQNVASHPDVDLDLDEIVAGLGPSSLVHWAAVIALWNDVAAQVDFAAPTRMTAEQYAAVDDAELRAVLQGIYRRMPDGRYVGLADVLPYMMEHFGGSRPKP